MDEPEAADAFDRAGGSEGPLVPQYELCARGMSRLLPRHGVVLDLGSGSGRYLAYLAGRRQDIQIHGLELSEPMLALGAQLLALERLSHRVHLIEGDMTDFLDRVPERVDLVSCVLALHQLQSADEVTSCLKQIATIRRRTGCAVWLWDLVRLKDGGVMTERMSAGPDPDPLFLRDALASEAASWTVNELTDMIEDARLDGLRHEASRPPLLQVHWVTHRDGSARASDATWPDITLPHTLLGRVVALRSGFQNLPF